MRRIVAGITSLLQHFQEIEQRPESYRPACCPECGLKPVWVHGRYSRKADLCHRGDENLNPVPILRYRCPGCGLTCSRLPECIAPRRWYAWQLQEKRLRRLLAPSCPDAPESSDVSGAADAADPCPIPARRTVQRWWHWLQARTMEFRFALSSRFPELGRAADGTGFWLQVFDTLGLSRAMAWCDQEMNVP